MQIKNTIATIFLVLIIIIGLSLFIFSDDSSQESNEIENKTNSSNIEKTEEEKCLEAGGEWRILSDTPEPKPECNLPTLDAEKSCTDSSQCESYCQAPENSEIDSEVIGTCYRWQKAACMREVRDGKADATWCY